MTDDAAILLTLPEGPEAPARLTLNRPARHNALEIEDMALMRALLDKAAAAAPRVLILTGAGDRTFCAGANLGDVGSGGGAAWDAENPLTALCDALEAFPAPIICALNGGVYGGGVELALSCDFRIGGRGMKAFVPPARLGIHYEPAGIRRAVTRLGPQMARRMFLLVEALGDEALLAAGFLDRLVERDEVAAAAEDMAATIAALAPLAVQGMKRTIDELARGDLDEAAARARITAAWASDDLREGLAAMKEKRKAAFTGR
jgi:enoyl-CoA hydratase/carnithine racemase